MIDKVKKPFEMDKTNRIKASKHVKGEKYMFPQCDDEDVQNIDCAQVYVEE